MKKLIIGLLVVFGVIILLGKIFGGSDKRTEAQINNDAVNSTPAYEQFHSVFKGEPETEDISKLMDGILDQYHMEHTEINKQKLGSVFYSLRTKSAIGISEMQLMKYAYQNYDPKDSFVVCASKAAVVLEYTK